jgi:tetratricopeptide (TPR) repeat protein
MIHWLEDKILQKMHVEVKIPVKKTIHKKIKFNLLAVIFFLIFGAVEGQKIDSLKALLHTASDLKRCDILYQLAYEYVEVDYIMGLQYAKEAFNAAKGRGDSLTIVRAGRIESLAYRRLEEMDSAITLSIQIIPIARRNNYMVEVRQLVHGLALAYTFKARYDIALRYHFQNLELIKKHGTDADMSSAIHNIGLLYYKMKDYNKALTYYKTALELKKEINGSEGLLINISLCYAYKNDFLKAGDFVSKALAACGQNCSEYIISNAYFNFGVIAFGLEHLAEAETQFLASYDIAKKIKDERFQLDNIVYLSQICIQRNEITLAENYLRKADDLMASGTPYNLELSKIYHRLFTLYNIKKDFKRSARYQLKYIQLKDSIYNEEHTRNLMP